MGGVRGQMSRIGEGGVAPILWIEHVDDSDEHVLADADAVAAGAAAGACEEHVGIVGGAAVHYAARAGGDWDAVVWGADGAGGAIFGAGAGGGDGDGYEPF